MEIKEVFEKANIGDDEKARRVLNISRRKASITAEEIENGVTLERLCDIGVPVLRYSSQVTIHGELPDFNPEARPAGYKALVRNQNGSVGVRYVAIDAAKKEILVKASRYSSGDRWSARISSRGLTVSKMFMEKTACIDAYRSFPKEMFYGTLVAFAGVYGGFYVSAEIGAIPEEKLWTLVRALWGFASEKDLAEVVQAEQDASAARAEEFKRSLEVRATNLKALKDDFARSFPNRRIETLPQAPGSFVRLSVRDNSVVPLLYVLEKRGPQTCYAFQAYSGQKSFKPEGKMKALDATKEKFLRDDLVSGFLFAA